MNKALCTLLVLLALAGSAGGFYYGRQQGFSNGYSRGYNLGKSAGKKEMSPYVEQGLNLAANNIDLTNKYNALVGDYNKLRESVIKYVGTVNVQSRQPITCNTYNYSYSNSSTTRCY